jgi:beta-galactosidase
VPPGVEVSRRVGAGKQVFILINYSQENRQVTLPHAMKSLLDDKKAETVDLSPYGVAVLLDSK